MKKAFSNFEIVTLAVYLLGGNQTYVDTEDAAIKANELSPGKFSWEKYPNQINIEKVRTSLSDAKKEKNGGYLVGKHSQGWLLSDKGVKFSQRRLKDLNLKDVSKTQANEKEGSWLSREKIRMLASPAFEKISDNKFDDITIQEAEAFFRLDEYVTGKARERKIERLVSAFNSDPDLGICVIKLAEKVIQNG